MGLGAIIGVATTIEKTTTEIREKMGEIGAETEKRDNEIDARTPGKEKEETGDPVMKGKNAHAP